MQKNVLVLLVIFQSVTLIAQTPKTYTSSEILMQMEKLNVLGSVLYIAAHPDDENTRLLAYLANEKLYRTGYLSLTRGDGGQNLIGDEQGIDLGLIRTQELLSARRIDGAQQFFSRAYDFGYCKTPEEALATWGHDKILSDVVWVIRKFRPDVIITRFPPDARAGHGHHAASAILASEAFDAAADSTKFPEQLTNGVTVWQAKRLYWNTYNFGNTNTQSEDQFKMDVGMYNPLLGKGYGEIAALSRSQHKSQGFGVAAQRGEAIEYFSLTKGAKPGDDLMNGVDVSWNRAGHLAFSAEVKSIIGKYDHLHPERSVEALLKLKKEVDNEKPSFWTNIKSSEINHLIETAGGLFLEATAVNQLNVIGDSMKVNITVDNRLGIPVSAVQVSVFGYPVTFTDLKPNENNTKILTAAISDIEPASQPYWLEHGLVGGSYDVRDQSLIGLAEDYKYVAKFQVSIGSEVYHFSKPVLYRYTDPVKAELYEPVQIVNPVFINSNQHLIIFKNEDKNLKRTINFKLQFNKSLDDSVVFKYNYNGYSKIVFDSLVHAQQSDVRTVSVTINSDSLKQDSKEYVGGEVISGAFKDHQYFSLTKISYDHIPDIFYNYYDRVALLKMDLKTSGSLIGYIPGAGDKVPEALEQMGYKVVSLTRNTITPNNIKQFDAIITGVRAYNTNEWMNSVYDVLMDYVKNGGVLLTQYNTSNQFGPVRAKILPYQFTISRNRVTDENAAVKFLLPNHPALNYPNKITQKDFEGWIQERSIYNAKKIDSNYQRILSMSDPGEDPQDGSLIISNYGKGKLVYTGLVFFRELPAGVPGAYRLFANLIANPLKQPPGKKGSTLKKAALKPTKAN